MSKSQTTAISRKSGTWMVLGAAVATLWFAVGASAWQEKTVWDGIYTEAQAERAVVLYEQKCSRCHAEGMTGKDAPPIVGPQFSSNWNDLTLDSLFTRIIVGMPDDEKGTLTRQQTADLLALMLATAEMPAGKTELPIDANQLKLIKYKGTKP